MKKMKQVIASAVLTVLACSANAAVFDNTTVTYQYLFPDTSTVFDHGSYYVPPAGVTIPNIAGSPALTLNIQGNDLTLNSAVTGQFAPGAFNGFEITDPSVTFSSFSLLSNTALSGSPVLSFDTHDLWVNMQNLGINPGTVQFAVNVPEPETYAMLLAGLGLIGFIAYRRKNDSSDMPMAA
jgi:hypothetical protein